MTPALVPVDIAELVADSGYRYASCSMLRAALEDPDLLDTVFEDTEVDDVRSPHVGAVLGAMRKLRHDGKPVDLDSIAAYMRGRDEALGLSYYLEHGRAVLEELGELTPERSPRILSGLARMLRRRTRVIADQVEREDERLAENEREQQEIDRIAFDELDPDGAPPFVEPPAPDPWQASLALARADVDRALGERRANERQPMFVPLAELFTREYPQTPWLVTGLITRGGVAVAGAQSKLGKKTWIVCEIALSVATGNKVFGEFFAERGVVGQFCAEDLAVQLRNRYRALAAGRGIAPTTITNLHVRPRGEFIDVLRNDDLAWVIASCRAIGRVDLVILDPLRDIHSGIEDSSDSMRDVMRRLRLIAELLGCTVLVTHHVPKTTQDNAKRAAGENLRGSGAIRGSLDAGIYVSPTGGDGVARFELSVTSEVKGARSAGCFDLALAIEDDAGGEAVRATWTFSREDKATTRKATAADADDELVFQFVRQLAMRGEKLSRRALRDHDERPLSEKRFSATLDRVIDGGRLVLSAGKVVLPEPTSSRGDS